MSGIRLDVHGAEAIVKKLDAHTLFGDPLRELITEATQLARHYASDRAPRGTTGQLEASIDSELHVSALPMYGVVKADAVARDGFAYAYALDASPRYHYAAGRGKYGKRGLRLSAGGKPTKAWLTKIPALVRSQINSVLKKTETQIARVWDR